MSRSSKLFIGLLSFLPIILTAVLFIVMFMQFNTFLEWENRDPAPQEMFNTFGSFFLIGIAMFLLSIALLIYFIIQLVRNKKMDSTERAIWILAFVLGGIICYPIYWYMKIWKEDL